MVNRSQIYQNGDIPPSPGHLDRFGIFNCCFLFIFSKNISDLGRSRYYVFTEARLTRFEERGHKKFQKGPLFAYIFWRHFQRVPSLLTFFEDISKGSPLCLLFLKKFQKNDQRGEYWLFLSSPSLNAPLFFYVGRCFCFIWYFPGEMKAISVGQELAERTRGDETN